MQIFLPYMISQRGGSIVNIASIVGERGFAQLGGYAASKSGMIGLTRSVAAEFARDNVRVNAICPGFAETSYTEAFKSNRPALYQTTVDRTPMGRWGSAEEIAHSIAYLLSDLSTYVTGSVMAVDGGWMAT
jgi:NAD(P)-dependent dehydrogenase (short-subunit alcohol dehydrogenase family)